MFLGAAPGVGKTFAMLDEGHSQRAKGRDVAIGLVEAHGRVDTMARIGDLEVVPRRTVAYRERMFEEMDLDAILVRRPEVVLVDELAHTNVPGSIHEKRWQDVEAILDAGIDVLTTLNIQHLESLNDVVFSITGVLQRETIPDEVVRRADEIELVDLPKREYAIGSPPARSTHRNGWMPPSPTTSVRGTCRRCGSWRSRGPLTASRRCWPPTATARESSSIGRPESGWSSASAGRPGERRSFVGRPAWR